MTIPIRHLLTLALAAAAYAPAARAQASLAEQVEIRRTAYGVPHIRADNFRAAGYALGYAQTEDHGMRIVGGLVRARGEMARHTGEDDVDSDFGQRLAHRRAAATFARLEPATREVYEGFAAGVNRFVELHPAAFPAWVRPSFTGIDVHAQGLGGTGGPGVRRFLARLPGEPARRGGPGPDSEGGLEALAAEDGSNAWALAPSRTRSGRAILLRNPHLAWSAGYYEAHVVVPGALDFYGDFRLGGPLGIVGGFNEKLGWATTNNSPDLDEIYSLDVDPARPDHYLFDGASVPLRRTEETIDFRNGPGLGRETRDTWSSPLGPVVHRGGGKVYVLRAAGETEFRGGEQFLKMMRARNRTEWTNAMKMRARVTSNLTYADRDGNIFYVWNATLPSLPHPSGGDTAAVPASRGSEVWTRVVPFDSLPQLLNPRGGYVRNENDPPYLTNLHQPLPRSRYPANFPEVELRLRGQHSLELIHNTRKVTLEDVVRMKHSMRMILADRVKDDLVKAVRATAPAGEVADAVAVLERWDNTVAAESRGGLLFETWWRRYASTAPQARPSAESVGFPAAAEALFRRPWTAADPLATPHGLADAARAVEAFTWAVAETKRKWGGGRGVGNGAPGAARQGGRARGRVQRAPGMLPRPQLPRRAGRNAHRGGRRRMGAGGGVHHAGARLQRAGVRRERRPRLAAPRRPGGDVRGQPDEARRLHRGGRGARHRAPLPPRRGGAPVMRRLLPALAGAILLAGCALRSDPAGPEQPARQPVHEAGKSYFGRDGYVEYIAGNSPVIITAPHGGELAPAEIPDRGCGTTVTDLATEQLARAFQFQFHRQTGRYPHVIINRLKRSKMDANRDPRGSRVRQRAGGHRVARVPPLRGCGARRRARERGNGVLPRPARPRARESAAGAGLPRPRRRLRPHRRRPRRGRGAARQQQHRDDGAALRLRGAAAGAGQPGRPVRRRGLPRRSRPRRPVAARRAVLQRRLQHRAPRLRPGRHHLRRADRGQPARRARQRSQPPPLRRGHRAGAGKLPRHAPRGRPHAVARRASRNGAPAAPDRAPVASPPTAPALPFIPENHPDP
jgi:acyl-homoserine-lactone acylase